MLLMLRDTREQKPLDLSINGVDKVEDICLPFGDYGCQIGQDKDSLVHIPILFARKGLGDLYGTMANTDNYSRFKKEMGRAEATNSKLILVVEGTYSDVLKGYKYSKFSGESMISKLNTLLVKYDLPCWYCESRAIMARRIVDFYKAIERNWKHDVLKDANRKTY